MADLGSKAVDSYEVRRKKKDIAQSTPSINISEAIDIQSHYVKPQSMNIRSSPSKDYEVPTKISSPKSHPTSSEPNPQTSTHTNDTPEFGIHSPKSTKNPSSARKLQQIFQQELTSEECKAQDHLFQKPIASPDKSAQIDSKNPEVKSSAPPTLCNARGDSYVEGDPHLGYPAAATLPRLSNTHTVHPLPFDAVNLKASSSSQEQEESKTIHKPNQPNKGNTKNWASIFKSQGPALDVKLEHFPELQRG